MTKEDLIDRLNEDLSSELGAIIMYLTYAARATGPYRPQLSQFFLAEVAELPLALQPKLLSVLQSVLVTSFAP